ncbi:MAG: hypothetical protein CR972_03170 [Candidatus Moraniibacteriota bacterium]|nr:MAG: hypothetical protein CR972_03170 [Candidatus Moranbacteria bacterium]
MKKFSEHKLIKNLKTYTFSIYSAGATFFSLIIVRLIIENWIANFGPRPFTFYFFEFLHTSLFFLLVFIIFTALLIKISKIPFSQSILLLLFGFTFIIFPPIFDWLISITFFNGANFMSYYLFDSINGLEKSFFTFFGDRPHDGITYGTRIMIACALFSLTLITWFKTKSLFRTISIIFIAYVIFFILSAFPSIITILFTNEHFTITRSSVAGFIASPTKILGNQIINPINAINIKMSFIYMGLVIITALSIIYKTRKSQMLSLLKNIRPIQTLYHIGLLFIGMGIAIMFNHAIILPSIFTITALFILCFAIIIAWYATVIFNDIVDQDIDKISNSHRPLIQKTIDEDSYKNIGIFLTILSITLIAMINPHASTLLIAYHAISYLYNTPPLRLKRFPLIATLLAAIASFFIVSIGFIIITPEHSLTGFPPHIVILLIIAYTISLPIKDIKDIAGDKKNNIYTIPVLCGEKVGRLVIAIGIFSSFILSIFALNNFALFFPALLAGSLCFWVLTGQKKEQFVFTPLFTIGIVFFIVSIYGLILALSLIS